MSKSKKLKCYFAHPFETKGTIEEKEIIEELKFRGLEVYEPFAKEDDILKKYNVKKYYKNPFFELGREIWTKCIGAVKKCDVLLGYLPFPSIGTAQEIAIAYEHKKFIIIISPLKHPSLSVYADENQLFESIEDWKRRSPYKWVNFKK